MRLTYTLGNSLYVPLTSRCNAKTLPLTRGPNFALPPDVVASLCRVRDAENSQANKWEPWCRWLDTVEFPQKLPAPLETISQLSEDDDTNTTSTTSRRPTVEELLQEILPRLDSSNTLSSIVIAGEGEPLLRLSALTTLVRSIKERDSSATATTTSPSVRVTTNGLITTTASDTDESTADDNVPQQLADCGVDSVSVALMTHDPDIYDVLMEPLLVVPSSTNGNNNARTRRAHDRVCSFIQASLKAGLQVEATAVDQPTVDKNKTEALASSLGISASVRWRSYFA